MCDSFPAARHDAITQLDDLGDADYLLGVVTLIRQQHQEEKDVGNDGLRISVWSTTDGFITYVTNSYREVLKKGLRQGFQKTSRYIALLGGVTNKEVTWIVPLQCTQTASGQSLWTPETQKHLPEWAKCHKLDKKTCKKHVCVFILSYLIWVQQAVVDSELHKLGEQVQYLSLQGHRGAGSVLLQSFDHQRLKQTNVVVDGILRTQRWGHSFQNSST